MYVGSLRGIIYKSISGRGTRETTNSGNKGLRVGVDDITPLRKRVVQTVRERPTRPLEPGKISGQGRTPTRDRERKRTNDRRKGNHRLKEEATKKHEPSRGNHTRGRLERELRKDRSIGYHGGIEEERLVSDPAVGGQDRLMKGFETLDDPI